MPLVNVPKIRPFDNRDPHKQEVRPFPLPDGIRVVYTISDDGVTCHVVNAMSGERGRKPSDDLSSFAPHIEEMLLATWESLKDERISTGFTGKEGIDYSAGYVVDGYLTDQLHNKSSQVETRNRLLMWLEDEFEIATPDTTKLVVIGMTSMPCAMKGRDTKDIFFRRSNFAKALLANAVLNSVVDPGRLRFKVSLIQIAPRNWEKPLIDTCAGQVDAYLDDQIDSCYERGFKGCLTIDIFAGWHTSANNYQIIPSEYTL